MKYEELLPKHKSDDSGIEELMRLSDEEIKPLIPRLLTWIQDINWPVASGVIEVISARKKIAEPYIAELLRPEAEDCVWKYWIIGALLWKWDGFPENDDLTNEILRIAEVPTEGERTEEVDIVANEWLDANAKNGTD